MLIFDDTFEWSGWGGAFRLGSGRCRLRIFDLKKNTDIGVTYLKRYIVVASDLASTKLGSMSVKSCNSHIATVVTGRFDIEAHRMQFVEYYPKQHYGAKNEHIIAERFDAVDFTWTDGKALKPVYRPLDETIVSLIRGYLDCNH